MKKIILSVLLCSLVLGCGIMSVSCVKNDADELVIWSYDTATTNIMVNEYKKTNPEAKIRVVSVDGGAYMNLLQTALYVEEDVPDIIWGDYFTRGKLFSLGICEDLTQEPYNLDTSLISDWVLDLCKDGSGSDAIYGIESGPAPTGLLYKRDICKKYLGTDDDGALSEMFSTWEGFVEACEKIYNDSNKTVIPFASIGDVYCIIVGMTNIPYMKDGKQNIDAVCDAVFEKLEYFVDKGLCGKMDQWTASYYTSYNNSKYAFNICPSWCPDYHIKMNAKDQDGNFGICKPAGGKLFSFGGTSFSIYKKSAHKAEAWDFIKWSLLTENGQINTNKAIIANGGSGGVGTLKTIYDNEIYHKEDSFFGGQKVLEFFISNMKDVNARPLTKYDTTFSDSLGLVLNSMKNGKSAAECKDMVIRELKLKLPELFK